MRAAAPVPFLVAMLLLLLAACGNAPDSGVPEVRRGPGPSYLCIVPRLSGAGLRQVTEQTPDGWRMRIEALSGPPTGWYSKGRIEYAAGTLTFAPDSATQGIAEDRLETELYPLLEECGARRLR